MIGFCYIGFIVGSFGLGKLSKVVCASLRKRERDREREGGGDAVINYESA